MCVRFMFAGTLVQLNIGRHAPNVVIPFPIAKKFLPDMLRFADPYLLHFLVKPARLRHCSNEVINVYKGKARLLPFHWPIAAGFPRKATDLSGLRLGTVGFGR